MFSRRALSLVTRSNRLAGVRMYTEGSTGATRSDGSSDAFTKREKAQEDYYIKQHQAEQIAKLKEQLSKQKQQLEELETSIKN